jgi:anthranilate/para-aminobenzoate synthase component I
VATSKLIPVSQKTATAPIISPKIDERGFVWLDSALQNHPRSTQSFIAEEPNGEIICRNNRLEFFGTAKELGHSRHSLYSALEAIYETGTHIAVGFISYEAMLEGIGISTHCHSIIPSAHFFLYDSFSSSIDDPSTLTDSSQRESSLNSSRLTHQISRDGYSAKIQRLKDYIREGDIYQANFTSRFDVMSPLHPSDVYHRLRMSNPGSHCGYLNFGDYQILSSSPERMFRLDGKQIVTNPIKGTIRRTGNPADDATLAETLLSSQKNLAELLMIVDLERNDLGRIAKTGTVAVDSLRKIELYSSLIHLVAEVSATIRDNCGLAEILTALLPGGSITGAPKRRAIEIIAELESMPRSVYTGCIGYIDGRNRTAEFNIAIRTMTHYDDRYEIHAGGGIVADSVAGDEYNEMMLKASRMLNSVGVSDRQENK